MEVKGTILKVHKNTKVSAVATPLKRKMFQRSHVIFQVLDEIPKMISSFIRVLGLCGTLLLPKPLYFYLENQYAAA